MWTQSHEEADWPFPDDVPNQGVFTTKRVLSGDAAIVAIVHDRDGDWQFLDDDVRTTEGAALVSLRYIVDTHPFVIEFADLARGEEAWQDSSGQWVRSVGEQADPG